MRLPGLKAQQRMVAEIILIIGGAIVVFLVSSSLIGCKSFSLGGLSYEDEEGRKVEVEGVEAEGKDAPSATDDEAES